MMDKIVVTAADIEKLLAWRDEHNDPVRSMPVPLREVEIQIVESGISIKCFRSDKKLKLYLDSPARKLGHVVFAPLGNGLWKKKVSTLPADCNPAETEQGALTVYGSLMALMTYRRVRLRQNKAYHRQNMDCQRRHRKSHVWKLPVLETNHRIRRMEPLLLVHRAQGAVCVAYLRSEDL